SESLKQSQTYNRDGMDIAICTFERTTRTLFYAGARSPMYLYDENNGFEKFDADRTSIGGRSNAFDYTLHERKLNSPTWIYLASDGFQDQFGGKSDRKFLLKNFRKLLSTLPPASMPDQKATLAKVINDWQAEGSQEQTDDIVVMGVKL
ncbi:MAG: SpoIIE family protein phosphatase, partial [Bacteroidota bacterium]